MRLTAKGNAIAIGYEWRQRIKVTSTPAFFPVGIELSAQARINAGDVPVIAEMTTENGDIIWIDENTIEVILKAVYSIGMTAGVSCMIDFVRTDTSSPLYLGLALRVPVIQPVTRW